MVNYIVAQKVGLSQYHKSSLNRINTRHWLDFSLISTTEWAQEYNESAFNILCDLICDVIIRLLFGPPCMFVLNTQYVTYFVTSSVAAFLSHPV